MRHLPVALLIILYVLVIGQNWAHYAAALMIYLYDRYRALSSVRSSCKPPLALTHRFEAGRA